MPYRILRNRLIRLAHENPGEVRTALLPLLAGHNRWVSIPKMPDLKKKYPLYREMRKVILGVNKGSWVVSDTERRYTSYLRKSEAKAIIKAGLAKEQEDGFVVATPKGERYYKEADKVFMANMPR